jgi:hypothetical protein
MKEVWFYVERTAQSHSIYKRDEALLDERQRRPARELVR